MLKRICFYGGLVMVLVMNQVAFSSQERSRGSSQEVSQAVEVFQELLTKSSRSASFSGSRVTQSNQCVSRCRSNSELTKASRSSSGQDAVAESFTEESLNQRYGYTQDLGEKSDKEKKLTQRYDCYFNKEDEAQKK